MTLKPICGYTWTLNKSLTIKSRNNPDWHSPILEDKSDEPIKVITQPIDPILKEALIDAIQQYLLELICE
jgi:hypothetical protein